MEKQNKFSAAIAMESTDNHHIVSQEKWIEARKHLLKKEKELTRLNDELARQRRQLPWVEVNKHYIFESEQGRKTLSDLFDGKSQLIIYHFMFAPGDKEGCPGCSFLADHIDGANLHLAHHDISVVVVSRAPLQELLPFKHRMEWKFEWVSSFGSDFNYDYFVSFTQEQLNNGSIYYNYEDLKHDDGTESPGTSVFFKDKSGKIYHTYSSYARGGDILVGAHNFLDITPKGRNEEGAMDWMRHHDKYDDYKKDNNSCCH
ncbi:MULTISPECIES: DUF899 domain-containing protein [Dyadobacter]|uniref:Thioredoxin family protein n=1 Tax=Dyadobacter chenhuakuii TaxID=2909339 RepID=A0ABY4XSM1_9BACT|nr:MULTISPECIES: thioredoxin family protein [Dyadobacter]MCE7070420.1 thioredoxin family protein [Dyadobacter sp. CY327]MCF2492720.1 thioredoxin family protein [Dyadobacter chenhuakuii]USJ32989.1 thioredoxin family protein [Dyadobacter chenhuakuii]